MKFRLFNNCARRLAKRNLLHMNGARALCRLICLKSKKLPYYLRIYLLRLDYVIPCQVQRSADNWRETGGRGICILCRVLCLKSNQSFDASYRFCCTRAALLVLRWKLNVANRIKIMRYSFHETVFRLHKTLNRQ